MAFRTFFIVFVFGRLGRGCLLYVFWAVLYKILQKVAVIRHIALPPVFFFLS